MNIYMIRHIHQLQFIPVFEVSEFSQENNVWMINDVRCRKKLNVIRYFFVSNKSIIGKSDWPLFVS